MAINFLLTFCGHPLFTYRRWLISCHYALNFSHFHYPAKPFGFFVCQFHISLHMSERFRDDFHPSSWNIHIWIEEMKLRNSKSSGKWWACPWPTTVRKWNRWNSKIWENFLWWFCIKRFFNLSVWKEVNDLFNIDTYFNNCWRKQVLDQELR